MPFGLLWCCYTNETRHHPPRFPSPMPFGLLWCCYVMSSDDPAGPCVSHQCLSAFCGVVTTRRSCELVQLIRGHQCLSAFCGVVTFAKGTHKSVIEGESPMPFGLLWCCYLIIAQGLMESAQVTNAFRPFVVLLPSTN